MAPQQHSPIWALIALMQLIRFQCAYQLCSELKPSESLTFCAKNTRETMLRTFWSEATSSCSKDPHKLLDLYETMVAKAGDGASEGDQCNRLLRHQLRKALVVASAAVFEDAIISGTFKSDELELKRLSTRLSQLDGEMLLATWDCTIDAIYYFVNRAKLIETLYSSASFESKVTSLLCLYRAYIKNIDHDDTFLPVITHYLAEIRSGNMYTTLPGELVKLTDKIYNDLPMSLRLYYTQTSRSVRGLMDWLPSA